MVSNPMTAKTNLKPWDGHTELPWRVCDVGHEYNFEIATDDGTLVCECEWYGVEEHEEVELQANAALIVHRVNSGPAADDMADALEWIHANYPLGVMGRKVARKALTAYRETSRGTD